MNETHHMRHRATRIAPGLLLSLSLASACFVACQKSSGTQQSGPHLGPSGEASSTSAATAATAAPASTVRATPGALRDQTIWQVPVSPKDPVKGSADAPVTIVMWGDFDCPFTSRSRDVLSRLDQQFPQQIRVVWKDNPLPFHKQAKAAATVARLAFERGGNEMFWKAHDQLFGAQQQLGPDTYRQIAQHLGLNADEVSMAIESGQYETAFQDAAAEAFDLRVTGAPHFFINGRRIPGAQPYESFEEVVTSRLAAARALVENGVAPANVYDEVLKTGRPPGASKAATKPSYGASNPVSGPKDAKVVIQVWCEFEATKCAAASAELRRAADEFEDQIKLVWRHLPEIEQHVDSLPAAEAAHEVYTQKGAKGFWAFHDQLMKNQNALLRADLERYATRLGVNPKTFKLAMDRHVHETQIRADMAVARDLGVRLPPLVTVNEYVLSGALDPGQLRRTIKRALNEFRALNEVSPPNPR